MYCLLCQGKRLRTLPLCHLCQSGLPWHQSTMIAFRYKPPINYWITQLKFHHQLVYAQYLGLLFSEKLKKRSELPEVILPIPLHTRRLQKRGFNQSLEIAKHIKHAVSIPLNIHSLKRIKNTEPQSKLTETERHKNLAHAFRLVKPIKAQHIALFDDVITTGSTIMAAYKILKHSGVTHIEIWCCAKT